MAGADSIQDRWSFEAWLKNQPEEKQRIFGIVIASRVALANVQYLGSPEQTTDDHVRAALKITFWRILIAKQQLAWMSKPLREADEATNQLAMQLGEMGVVTKGVKFAAAGISANNASAASVANSLSKCLEYVDQAISMTVGYQNIRNEAKLLENGLEPFSLYNIPLNVGSFTGIYDHPARLRQLLRSESMAKEDWPIWLQWYQPIAEGKPAFYLKDRKVAEALERHIALGGKDGKFHKEFWDREPRQINRDIAEWVAEAWAFEGKVAVPTAFSDNDFPRQSPNATMFGLSHDGEIDRVAVPPEQRLLITPQQQKEYEAIRDEASKLSSQGQILGKLGVEVSDLLVAMPIDMTHAYLFDVWRALNRLRRTMNAHVKVAADKEPHEAKLDPGIAEDLGALLDIANNFAFADPGIRSRDENSIPPQDRPTMQAEKQLGDGLVKAALETPELLTLDAASSVRADETNADRAGDDAHGQQAVDQTNKTRKNLFAAILSTLKKAMVGEIVYSWKEYRGGAYKAAGAATVAAAGSDIVGTTTIYPTIWQFITTHAVELLRYAEAVFQNPAVTKVLEQIVKFLGG
jgi:hypothetical protein